MTPKLQEAIETLSNYIEKEIEQKKQFDSFNGLRMADERLHKEGYKKGDDIPLELTDEINLNVANTFNTLKSEWRIAETTRLNFFRNLIIRQGLNDARYIFHEISERVRRGENIPERDITYWVEIIQNTWNILREAQLIQQVEKNETFYEESKSSFVSGISLVAISIALIILPIVFSRLYLLNAQNMSDIEILQTQKDIYMAIGILLGAMLANFARIKFQQWLATEAQQRPTEPDKALLPNAIDRRDKVRRNANFVGLLTILAAIFPAILTEISYIKAIKNDSFRIAIFAVILLINLYNMIMTKINGNEVYLYSGKVEPAGVVKWKMSLPFEDFHDFIIRFLPEFIIILGFAFALGRVFVEIFKAI